MKQKPKMNVVNHLDTDDIEDDEIETVDVAPKEFTTVSGIRAVTRSVVTNTAIGGGAVNGKYHTKKISVARISMIDGKS